MKKILLVTAISVLCAPQIVLAQSSLLQNLKGHLAELTSSDVLSKDLTVIPRNEQPQKVTIDIKKALYTIGEYVEIRVKTGEAGCLSLWDKGSSGKWSRLFPNNFKTSCMLPAGTHNIGVEKDKYGFTLSGPTGQETLYAVWSKDERTQPSSESLISNPKEALTKDLTLTSRINRNDWATAKTIFTVTNGGVVQPTFIPSSSHPVDTKQKVYILAMGSNVGELVQSNNDATNYIKGMKAIYPQAITKFIKNVTVAQFKQGMKWLKDNVNPTDLVMIFYSGHGSTVVDDNGDEKDGFDEIFVTYDVESSGPFAGNVVRDDQFAAWVNAINSDNILTVIDACHSGGLQKSFFMDGSKVKSFQKGELGMTNAGAGKSFADSLDKVKGLVLAAAGEDENALEYPDGSLFVNSLLKELGKADSGENLLTVFERSKKLVNNRTKSRQIPVAVGKYQIAKQIVLK